MKKLLAILCAVMLVLTCSISVFAEGETGSITINNAVAGQTYSIYKIASVTYNTAKTAYEYVAVDEWVSFFTSEAGATYFMYDETTKVVTAKEGVDNDDGAAIAVAAIAFATSAENLEATDSKNADSTTVVFENLELGYYLIDSTVGTLCILNTTNPNFSKDEKNAPPSATKEVEEDSDNSWGNTNDANIGQTVNFKITVTVKAGAKNYVVHDKMSNGLTLDETTIKVYDNNGNEVVNTEGKNDKFTVVTASLEDDCTFEVGFNNDYLATLGNTTLVVKYSATVNNNAVIGGEGNPNETHLSYGDDNNITTTPSKTTTYSYSFDLVKTDSSDAVLDGAKFKLYAAETGENEIKVVKVSEGVYRVAVGTEEGVEIETVNGVAVIKGLDGGTTYYLEETVAPVGYNKLTARQPVTISSNNNSATVENGLYKDGGIQVVNNTGNILPETGGIGTTLFIAIGSIVVLVCGVVLVARKRMSKYIA